MNSAQMLVLLFDADDGDEVPVTYPTRINFARADYYAPGAVANTSFPPGFRKPSTYAPGFRRVQGDEQ